MSSRATLIWSPEDVYQGVPRSLICQQLSSFHFASWMPELHDCYRILSSALCRCGLEAM